MTILDFDEYKTRRNRKRTKRNIIIANNDNQSVNLAPPNTNIWTDDGWCGHFQNVNGQINFIPIYRRQVGV